MYRRPAPSGAGKPPGRHTGIAVALLLHLLVLGLVYLQISKPARNAANDAAQGLQTISLLNLQAPVQAAPAPPLPVEQPEPAPPQPVPEARPKPKPKPRPVVRQEPALIAAPTPTAQPPAASQAEAPPAPAAAPAPAPAAAAAPAATAGMVGPQRFTLTPAENDRLERAYSLLVSRAIASKLKGSVLMQQLGGSGQALVRLTIARNGQLISAVLLRGTGFRHLDDEARFVADRIGRFAPPPSLLRPDNPTIVIDQPVTFIPQ